MSEVMTSRSMPSRGTKYSFCRAWAGIGAAGGGPRAGRPVMVLWTSKPAPNKRKRRSELAKPEVGGRAGGGMCVEREKIRARGVGRTGLGGRPGKRGEKKRKKRGGGGGGGGGGRNGQQQQAQGPGSTP